MEAAPRRGRGKAGGATRASGGPALGRLAARAALVLALAAGAAAPAARAQEGCNPGYAHHESVGRCALRLLLILPDARASHGQIIGAAYLAAKHVNLKDGAVVGDGVAQSVSRVFFAPKYRSSEYTSAGSIAAFNAEYPMAGVIGAARSASSIPLAYHAAGRGVPQLSASSTSATLSNAGEFPYFYRTVPGDDLAVYAGAGLIGNQNWRNIALLYVNDGYGLGYLNSFRKFEVELGVNVRAAFAVETDAAKQDFRDVLEKVKNQSLYIIFVVLGSGQNEFFEVAEELGMTGKGYQYLLSDTFQEPARSLTSPEDIAKARKRIEGSFIVLANGFSEPGPTAAVKRAYRELLTEVFDGPADSEARKVLGRAIEVMRADYEAEEISFSGYFGFAYDNVWMLALAAQRALEAHPAEFAEAAYGKEWAGNVTQLLTGDSPIELPEGVSGKPVRLASNGDRDETTVAIKVYNYLADGTQLEVLQIFKQETGLPEVRPTGEPIIFGGGSTEPPLDGWSCPAGNMYTIDKGCLPCERGQFLNSTTRLCQVCPVGSFSNHEASIVCTPCTDLPDATVRYQDAEGATECKLCPEGTVRPGNRPGHTLDECLCKPGFYQKDRIRRGAPCMACEKGGVCPGSNQALLNNTLAYPERGYWGEVGYQNLFVPCMYEDVQCLGGSGFECAEGYEGKLCDSCAKDYYKLAGRCSSCHKNKQARAFIFVTVTFLIFALWFGVNKLTAGRFDAADIFLHFMQISDIIGNFSLTYDDNIESWKVASGFVNFDVDIITMWQCYVKHDYLSSFILICAISWIKLTISGFFHGFNIAMGKASGTRFGAALLQAMGHTVKSEDDLRKDLDEIIEEFANMYIITYNALCYRCFSVFMGRLGPDGTRYMAASPAVTMGSDFHTLLVTLGLAGCVVYVVGIPGVTFYCLWSAKQNNKLATVSFLRRYGFLYRRYESQVYYWEVVLLMRRFFMTAVLVFLQDYGTVQAAAGCIIISICIALQFAAQPFRDDNIDRLDNWSCLINLLYIATGVVQTHGHSGASELFGGALVFAIACMLLFAVYLLALEATSKYAVQKSNDMTTSRIAKILLENPIPSSGETKEEAKTRVARIMGASDLAFQWLDVNRNQEITWSELHERFHYLCGDPELALTEEQSKSYVGIMDETGSGAVNSYEFLAHVARELLARNTPAGRGTGIRATLMQKGLHPSAISDAIYSFVVRAEAAAKGMPSPRRRKKGDRSFTMNVALDLDLMLAETANDRLDIAVHEAALKGFESRAKANAEVAAEHVLHEMPYTLEALGMQAWLEKGTTPEQIFGLLRLETFLLHDISDTGALSEYQHTPRAQTFRNFVSNFPFIVGYVTDPKLDAGEVAALSRFVDAASKHYEEHGSWQDHITETINVLDHASILHWSLDSVNDVQRVALGTLMRQIASAKEELIPKWKLMQITKMLCGVVMDAEEQIGLHKQQSNGALSGLLRQNSNLDLYNTDAELPEFSAFTVEDEESARENGGAKERSASEKSFVGKQRMAMDVKAYHPLP